jgi:hypothetical protein
MVRRAGLRNMASTVGGVDHSVGEFKIDCRLWAILLVTCAGDR